jgi:hypothetical protein
VLLVQIQQFRVPQAKQALQDQMEPQVPQVKQEQQVQIVLYQVQLVKQEPLAYQVT